MMRRMKPLRWAGDVRAAVSAGCLGERAAALPIWDRASSVEGKESMSLSGCCPTAVYAISSMQTVKMVLYPFFIDCSVKGDPKIGIIFRMRKTAGGCRGWTRLSGINVYLCCSNPPVCGFAGGESGASFTEFDDADNQTCPGRRSRGIYRW